MRATSGGGDFTAINWTFLLPQASESRWFQVLDLNLCQLSS